VSDRNYFFCIEGGLEATECAAAVFDVLDDTVEVLKMFPDKVADAWVVGDVFIYAIQEDVCFCWATNWDVVDVRDRSV